MIYKRIIFFIFLNIFSYAIYAQKTDSIEYYSYIDTIKLYQKILKTHKNLSEENKKWLYNYYVINYYAVRKLDGKMKFLLNAIASNKEYVNKYNEGITYYYLWYYSISNNDKSFNLLLNKILNTKRYSKGVKIKALNQASFKYVRYDVTKASKFLNYALKIGLKDSLPQLYNTFLNLSAININYSLIPQAENYLKIGLKFKNKNSNPIIDMLYKHNTSTINYVKQQSDKSLKLLKECSVFFKKYKIFENDIGSSINIARQYIAINKIDSAFIYTFREQESVLKNEKVLTKPLLIRYYWLLSNLYLNKNNIDSAVFFIRKSINWSKFDNQRDIQKNLFFDLANIYMMQEKKDSAYYYIVKAYEINNSNLDSIRMAYASENSNKIELLNEAYKNKELEVNLLENENKLQRIHNNFKYLVIIIILLTIVIFFIFRNLYLHKIHYLKEKHAKDLILYQEFLNQQISMELHDNIGQGLIVLSKNMKIQQEDELLTQILKSISDLREISHNIYPNYLLNFSFVEAINNLAFNTEKNSKFTVITELDNSINSLKKEILLQLYRICQELISNSLKYCKGTIIYIHIYKKNNKFIFEYKDVDEENEAKKITKGFGLNSIILRTQIIDGNINISYNKGFFGKITFKNE